MRRKMNRPHGTIAFREEEPRVLLSRSSACLQCCSNGFLKLATARPENKRQAGRYLVQRHRYGTSRTCGVADCLMYLMSAGPPFPLNPFSPSHWCSCLLDVPYHPYLYVRYPLLHSIAPPSPLRGSPQYWPSSTGTGTE